MFEPLLLGGVVGINGKRGINILGGTDSTRNLAKNEISRKSLLKLVASKPPKRKTAEKQISEWKQKYLRTKAARSAKKLINLLKNNNRRFYSRFHPEKKTNPYTLFKP